MAVCSQCDNYFEGFNYGYGYNFQCGKCNNEEKEYYRRKEIQENEIVKLKLEIEKLKNFKNNE
tara:strand:+ start:186 stop:374 length:189 start_codon:yes stop_codon:yes gene_type:complete